MNITKFTITQKEIPDGGKIASLRFEQFKAKINDTEASDLNKEIATEMFSEQDPIVVLSKILEHYANNSFGPNAYKSLPKVKDTHDSRSSSNTNEARIRFDKGIADDFTGKTLIQFIEKKSGLSGGSINDLNVKRHFLLLQYQLTMQMQSSTSSTVVAAITLQD